MRRRVKEIADAVVLSVVAIAGVSGMIGTVMYTVRFDFASAFFSYVLGCGALLAMLAWPWRDA